MFNSAAERKYWFCALLVICAIASSLIFGSPIQSLLADQDVQAVLFLAGMGLSFAMIVVQGLRKRPGVFQLSIWLGIAAVYLTLFLRLGLSERSHLIEYSVLAAFTHQALIERNNGSHRARSAGLAILLASFIGTLDECIQLCIPSRVFNPEDIVFNISSAIAAVGSLALLQWLRNSRKA